jgi:protein-disulfide isomerase
LDFRFNGMAYRAVAFPNAEGEDISPIKLKYTRAWAVKIGESRIIRGGFVAVFSIARCPYLTCSLFPFTRLVWSCLAGFIYARLARSLAFPSNRSQALARRRWWLPRHRLSGLAAARTTITREVLRPLGSQTGAMSYKPTLIFLLLVSLACSAQLAPTDLAQRIERRIRTDDNVPVTVKVIVSSPRVSEFPNYDTVTVTFDSDGKKQNYEFLLSTDRKTLVRVAKIDLSKDPYLENLRKIDVKGRPVRGNPNAKVVAVNYDDFQCPYCSRVHQTLFPELLKEYGDRVAFIYKDFPLSEIHPWAVHAAVNANCLASQSNDAYWDFADYTHANRQSVDSEKGLDNQLAALDRIAMTEVAKFGLDSAKLQSCVKAQNDKAVKASVKEGESLGITGTPTMFVNGQMIDGAQPASEFRALFDSALKEAGVPAPTTPPTPAAAASTTSPR